MFQSVVTLPADVQTFLDLGFTSSRVSEEMAAGSFDQLELTREGITLTANIENPGDSTLSLAESTVWSISLSQETIENEHAPVYFPGGITIGSYLEDVDVHLADPYSKTLIGGETFQHADELLYVWEDESDDPQSVQLEYSIHPQTKQVFYIHSR